MNSLIIIHMFYRRIRNILYMSAKMLRKLTSMRTKDVMKYIQIIVTIVLLVYIGTAYLHGFFTEKEDEINVEEKSSQIKDVAPPQASIDKNKEQAVKPIESAVRPIEPAVRPIEPAVKPIEPAVRPIESAVRPIESRKLTTTTTKATPIIDKDVIKRNDTTPEKTQKLPFLSNYKSPCWKELDEIMTTEVKLTCLPYFYVIGVSQCGTKDLFERLTQHPLISGNVKPGNRWFTRLRYGGFPYLSDYLQYYYHAVETDVKRITTKDGYHNAIFGDFTPSTIWDNHYLKGAAKKMNMTDPPYTHADVIKYLNPNARIIILMCEPVERLLTDYIQIARDFQALPQAEEFHSHVINALNKFTNCLKNSTYLSCVYFGKPSSSYRAAGLSRIEIGLYDTHVQNILKTFPKNQVLIIKKETLNKETPRILQNIFDFLDVGPINDPTVWNHITTFEDSKPDRPFGDMKPETRQILQDFYKSHNTKLGAMLGPEFDYNTNS